MEDSTWAKDVDVMFCNACYSISLAYNFEEQHHGARKELDQALKKKLWYLDYYRCCWNCDDHGNYPKSAAMWNKQIDEDRRWLEGCSK